MDRPVTLHYFLPRGVDFVRDLRGDSATRYSGSGTDVYIEATRSDDRITYSDGSVESFAEVLKHPHLYEVVDNMTEEALFEELQNTLVGRLEQFADDRGVSVENVYDRFFAWMMEN